MKSQVSHSIEETNHIAHEWLSSLAVTYSQNNTATIVGLSGNLGSGKTAFTKAVAEVLGITENVTSPTFVLMKKYGIEFLSPNFKFLKEQTFPWKYLIHIDAYRLEDGESLKALEWDNLISHKDNLILIEWPEQVGITNFAPQCHISFEAMEETTSRKIDIA
jgi:tRNA threonylcarbamoyladenosine biosynthesis protein TsaE